MNHGLFWEHVGQLSFVKPMSHITRFWTRFWGTPFWGSPQWLAGHPQPFYEGSQRPLRLRSCGDIGGLCASCLQSSALICTGLHLSANSLQITLIRLHVLQCTMACFGDMLGSFPLSNRCLISLDFGHVSGVPLFEALPNGWLDIPNHFMKGRNDPFGSGLVVTLGGFVRLVCNQLH